MSDITHAAAVLHADRAAHAQRAAQTRRLIAECTEDKVPQPAAADAGRRRATTAGIVAMHVHRARAPKRGTRRGDLTN